MNVLQKENGNVTQHLKLSKNPKKDVSIGAQGDSLKASAQQVDDSRSKQQSTKSPVSLLFGI